MTEKRFTIKLQDDYFGVTDNYSADKGNVVNGIRTEIEAEWLCELLNELNDENKQLKNKLQTYKTTNSLLKATMDRHRTENQQIRDTIKEMYETERTALGRSVLKQLLEAIQ